MKNLSTLYIFLAGSILIPYQNYAQETQPIEVEQSAELFLEEYTDEFQENFFEALKQKGIENYDKAINLLLACKLLDDKSTVVDHELANVYLADKQYVQAKQYGLEALHADPSNYWYLNTLVAAMHEQGATLESFRRELPYANEKLKENLALVLFKKERYESALEVLKEIRQTEFSRQLSLKIQDSLDYIRNKREKKEEILPKESEANPLAQYRLAIEKLLLENDLSGLLKTSTEALEQFPSQPYFYFSKGVALNGNKKYELAIKELEAALDYLLDDASLADKIYKELATAYKALGNSTKANMYLSKIKSGS